MIKLQTLTHPERSAKIRCFYSQGGSPVSKDAHKKAVFFVVFLAGRSLAKNTTCGANHRLLFASQAKYQG
jgi:hypothetical protein